MEDMSKEIEKLYRAFINIETVEECRDFFADIFTGAEVEQFAQRLHAAELLLEGQTYAQITAQTDISSATLSRVSNCIQRGAGGYRKIIERSKK